MNSLEKYLANEQLNLKDPSTRRELYQNISDGLEKTGPESSLACSGLHKYITEQGKEPEYPEFSEGTPSKNLAYEIRCQNILPSMETNNTYRTLCKNELPGIGDRTDSEIQSMEKNLAYDASGLQRGFPESTQEKLGLEIMEKPLQNTTEALTQTASNIKNRLEQGAQLISKTAMEQVHGSSKALTGLLNGDKELYAQGMQECAPLGMLNKAYQTQKEGYKNVAEVLLGKKTFEDIGLKIQPLETLERGIETISQALTNPKETFEKGLNILSKIPNSRFPETQEKPGQTGGNGLPLLSPAVLAAMEIGNNPKAQEKIQEAYKGIEQILHPLMNPKKTSALSPMATPLGGSPSAKEGPEPMGPSGKKEPNTEPEEEAPSQTKKAEDPPFFERFAGLLSSRVAFDKAIKKGASPKQAGDLSQAALTETQESTKGMDKSLNKNQEAMLKGAKTFATHALSKAALAVPPPLGVALSLSVQLASGIADSIGDKEKDKEKNPQSPQSSPLQGLAEAIPGNLDSSGGMMSTLAKKGLKIGKANLKQSFPNGMADVGDAAGEATRQQIAKKPNEFPDHSKMVDRPV
jgi:hypothetical protein